MKIYIVDDDSSIRSSLKEVLQDEDFEVEDFANGKNMLKALMRERPALILLDVWMGKEDGLDILTRVKEEYPALPVVMISGHGTIEQAVQATKKGAVDFIEKPLSLDHVLQRINEILKIDSAARDQKRKQEIRLEFDEIIGESPQIRAVKRAIAQAAGTNARVFIYGENGTGKELVARAIFQNSRRVGFPFIEVNCAAIPEELIESELFGHEKGAFTGAADRRIGRFEMAHQGTLFLDEICDMSLATQARVLRALQEQRFARVGGSENIEVDVRIIAATNIDPVKAIAQGRFREDLYYRLNVIPIQLPALRERTGDIPLLLDYFLRAAAQENQIPIKRFSQGAMEMLQMYAWPGNVRELKNVVERLSIMSQDDEITVDTAAEHLRSPGKAQDASPIGDLKRARDEFEKNYIIQALKQHEKNITRAAKFLGMDRTNLHRKLKSLGIDPEAI